MPYICLATANLPGRVLQITDLWPNESQRIPGIDPPGQNRYLSRPAPHQVAIAAGVVSPAPERSNLAYIEGLTAYLVDRVDPGAAEQPTADVTLTGALFGDTVTFTDPTDPLNFVTFTAINPFPTATVTILGGLTFGETLGFNVTGGGAPGGVLATSYEDYASDTLTFTANWTAANAATFSLTGAGGSVNFAANVGGNDFLHAGTLLDPILLAEAAINGADGFRLALADVGVQALFAAALGTIPGALFQPAAGVLGNTPNGPDAGPGNAPVIIECNIPGVYGVMVFGEGNGGGGAGVSSTSGTGPVQTNPNPAAPSYEFGTPFQYASNADPAGNVTTSAAALVAVLNQAAFGAALALLTGGPTLDGAATNFLGVVRMISDTRGEGGEFEAWSTDDVNMAVLGDDGTAELVEVISPDPAAQEFAAEGYANPPSNANSATSLAAAMNDAATDALLVGLGLTTVTAAALANVVTVTADAFGSEGALLLSSTNAVREALSDDHLARTHDAWTTALANDCADAIQAEVDAGNGLTVALLNTAVNAAVAGAQFTLLGAASTATLADVLSILAGRVYRVPTGTSKALGEGLWDTTAAGSFTTPNVVFDSEMSYGEWRPTAGWRKTGGGPGGNKPQFSGGDTVNNEVGGVRTTVDSTHFQSSLQTGQLSHYAAGITLFPDADVQAFVSNWVRRTHRQGTLTNQRVVTVYDDDGSLLA